MAPTQVRGRPGARAPEASPLTPSTGSFWDPYIHKARVYLRPPGEARLDPRCKVIQERKKGRLMAWVLKGLREEGCAWTPGSEERGVWWPDPEISSL